ncbi:MAG: guanylate kinase [bacterium]
MNETTNHYAQGQLYVIAAPSGAGKTSMVAVLLRRLDHVCLSISHTTRQPRPKEEHGKHYFFTNPDDFLQGVERGDFLEYAKVFDNYYGTSHQQVKHTLAQGKDVILEIDWQGAQQIKAKHPNVISIFILPPSLASLEQRLTQRQQDSQAVIARRMRDAAKEMSHYHEFDYLIINDDFEVAMQDLISIFHCQRLRTSFVQQQNKPLLADLDLLG